MENQKKDALMLNSQKYYLQNLIKKEDCFEISIFSGILTNKVIVESSIKLKQAFPALTKDFFSILADRIKEHNYSDDRLKNAINHVIDNCIYPTPTVAQFISFDKRVKLYTYDMVLKMLSENHNAFEYYRPIRIKDAKKPFYAHTNDISLFKLEIWT
jgi:hypothetical protein